MHRRSPVFNRRKDNVVGVRKRRLSSVLADEQSTPLGYCPWFPAKKQCLPHRRSTAPAQSHSLLASSLSPQQHRRRAKRKLSEVNSSSSTSVTDQMHCPRTKHARRLTGQCVQSEPLTVDALVTSTDTVSDESYSTAVAADHSTDDDNHFADSPNGCEPFPTLLLSHAGPIQPPSTIRMSRLVSDDVSPQAMLANQAWLRRMAVECHRRERAERTTLTPRTGALVRYRASPVNVIHCGGMDIDS